MADLIDQDAVLHDISTECSNAHEAKYYEAQVALTRAKRIIRDAPAVNRWIPVEDDLPEIRPKVKPDLDNVAKTVCDALNGQAYRDDAQIAALYVRKWYDEKPRVEVQIRTVTDE